MSENLSSDIWDKYPKLYLMMRIKQIQASICSYNGSFKCDCKYSIDNIHLSGEHSGCPECYLLMDFFSAMTEKEYNRVIARMKKKETSVDKKRRVANLKTQLKQAQSK